MKLHWPKVLFVAICSFGILLCGCGEQEQTSSVVVEAENNVMSFSLVPTQYDDVILTKKIDCKYVQTSEQEVSFDTTGKYVDKVYVKEGQYVKKGDLLCELNSSSLEKQIEDLEYKIKKNELKLSYLDTNEELDIQDVWVPVAIYGTGDDEAIKEKVKSINEQYSRQRVLINDSLEFDREEYNKLVAELKASRLYASLDGKVYKIDSKLEGSTTKAGKVIMTIVDKENCIFETDEIDVKDYIDDSDELEMHIMYSGASGDYIITPYNRANWADTMQFEVLVGPENSEIEVGTTGSITVVIDEKNHVLSLPKTTVHTAGDSSYVYVMNEDNFRDIKYIEIGLTGDTRVEIVSGLDEGEKVIMR